MSNIYDNQIKEMQRLINYGRKDESTTVNSQPIVEYHALGADGKTYGIIREGHNFYIKVAPKKDTKVIAEDYDYIGGFNNKKANEYSTYTLASKQFDLKMKALNEAYNKKVYTTQYTPSESAEWQINETKEMRKELNRFNQIVENVNKIIEGKDTNFIGMAHELPEAPAKNPSQKKVNAPFTDVAVAPEDKDLKYAENQFTKTGPYSEGGEVTNKDMESDKKPSGKKGDVYTEKAKYTPKDSVADKRPAGGKVVKVNEGRTVKINEEQVLAWSKSKDFMDKSKGTQIGSSAPFSDEVDGCANGTYCEADTEPIREGTAVHNTDNQNSPRPGISKPGHNGDPFEERINEIADFNMGDIKGNNVSPTTKAEIFQEGLVDGIGDAVCDVVGGITGGGNKGGVNEEEIFQEGLVDGIGDAVCDVVGGITGGGNKGGVNEEEELDEIADFNMGDIKGNNMSPTTKAQIFQEGLVDGIGDAVCDVVGGITGGGNKGGVNEETVDYDDAEGFDDDDLDLDIDIVDDEDVEDPELYDDDEGFEEEPEFDDTVSDREASRMARSGSGMRGLENYLDDWDKFDDDDEFYESRRRSNERIYEVKLNDFGKHPAYRKEVMTLPPNKEIDRYGRDWNDDSAKGEEPFGKQIGSSAPYTEKVVDMLTDAIFNKISKKKV